MKWTYQDHRDGDVRVIRRFLLFPRCVNGECRWLCFANIEQIYDGYNYADDGWHDVQFVKHESRNNKQ